MSCLLNRSSLCHWARYADTDASLVRQAKRRTDCLANADNSGELSSTYETAEKCVKDKETAEKFG